MKLIESISISDVESKSGIFSHIEQIDSQTTLTWLTEDFALELDEHFYFVHSAQKTVSKQYEWVIAHQDDLRLGDPLTFLATIILNKFGLSWSRIHDAIVTAYKPLENYDMSQTESPNVTKTKTVKQNVETQNDVYGFNSSVAIPQSKSTVNGAKLDNEESESETGTRGLTRHGNSGVTTSQQMLQSEIDLRSNYHFIEQLMNDVDSIMCLLVY